MDVDKFKGIAMEMKCLSGEEMNLTVCVETSKFRYQVLNKFSKGHSVSQDKLEKRVVFQVPKSPWSLLQREGINEKR